MNAPGAAVMRGLRPSELDQFRRHLRRLDDPARVARFGHWVGEEWLSRYAGETDWASGAVLGCWVEGRLRGVAELRRVDPGCSSIGEVALSVEAPFQNRGLGTTLAHGIAVLAQDRGVGTLRANTQGANVRALRILAKLGARLKRTGDRFDAEIALAPASGMAKLADR